MHNKLTAAVEQVSPNSVKSNVSRRNFFGSMGKAALTIAAAGTIVPFLDKKSSSVSAQKRETSRLAGNSRAEQSYQLRVAAAEYNLQTSSNAPRLNNGDEDLYPNKIASYSNGLPHNSNGEVDLSVYNTYLSALESGDPAQFEQIRLGGVKKLTNPQSGLAFDLEGCDSFSTVMPPPPAFASREIAAEIAENYWMALLRDVPYSDYANNAIAQAAANDLTLFGDDFKGAKNANGQVTPTLLFRGVTNGDKLGPHTSQFFYLPYFLGANEVSQRIQTVRGIADGGRDYMTDFASWLNVINGGATGKDVFDPTPKYIRNGRDMGQWTHIDFLYQGYLQAFLILTGTLHAPFDKGNPYNNSVTQSGFGTFGAPQIAALLGEVSTRALQCVWNQKWFVHRRLRPEVFAARVHRTLYENAAYPVHPEILNSVSTASRLGGFMKPGNALLPMAFPEGSPTHPSYGSGHATVAGACVTILKAFFDESAIIKNPVSPDSTGQVLIPFQSSKTLTVGGELNKLASNVALGRNTAGVHWRSDATEGLRLGEEVAITVLRDHKACYSEQFGGFSLTKFDGTQIMV